MASMLAPPPATPPHNSPAPEANLANSRASSPESDDPAPEANPANSRASSPESDDAMQVEARPLRILQVAQQSTNPVGDDTPQPSPRSTNPADDDSDMDVDEQGADVTSPSEPTLRRTSRVSKPVNPGLNAPQMSATPPLRKSKGKQEKKTLPIPKTEPLPLRPLVFGSKYMHLRFIDLTQVEVSAFSFLSF